MKLRDLFDISMAEFYELKEDDWIYNINKEQIPALIQGHKFMINKDILSIKPIMRICKDENFKFEIGLSVKIN